MRPKPIRLFSRAVILLLMMLFTATTAWAWSGSGTSADPYKITNANDLIQLATDVNGGTSYSGKYFKQTAPITLSSAWTPIGTSTHPFMGHYDGGNNAISGLTVSGNYKYAGLFGYISSDLVNGCFVSNELQNINIVDCNINVGSSNNSGSKAGGIAGQTGPVHLSDCRVSGTITAYNTACGLVGYADQAYGNRVTNCFVDVTISATGKQYNQYVTPIARLMLSVLANTPTASGNYYHDNGGNVDVGCSATPLYTIGVPSGLTVAETNASVTFNGKRYFATNANATLTVDDANQVLNTLSVNGATYSVAANKKSATITLGTADVNVSVTLMALSGTSDGVTWSLSDTDSNDTYDRLTLSGSGTLSTPLWDDDFASSILRVDISSASIAISGNPFSALGNSTFIVAPSLAYAVSYASADFAGKFRVALGSYLFGVTTKGGSAYAISTADDLRNLAAVVNEGNPGSNKTFRQTKDIAFDYDANEGDEYEENYTPIGCYNSGNHRYFEGFFDGDHHIISGIRLRKTGTGSANNYQALFGNLGANGRVYNVHLNNARIKGNSFVGGIIGMNSGNVRGCAVTNSVINANSKCGVICGNRYQTTQLHNNYYHGCTVNGVANATGVGYDGCDFTTDNGAVSASPNHFVQNSDGSYTIKTGTGWDVFCGLLAIEAKGYFDGKTVTLDGNIGVSRMAGTSSKPFTGKFNGQGYKLTFNATATEASLAPFRYVEGGRIENLCVTGTLQSGYKYAAGLIAQQYGETTISNCRSNVIIKSSVDGDGTHGGFVAATNGTSTVNFEGCVFDGSLQGESTKCWGGFVGWKSNSGNVNVSNSLFAPASVTIDASDSYTFARRSGTTITNSYYVAALGTAQGKALHTIEPGENVTISNIALTGDATVYNVSGITAYSGGGLKRTVNDEPILYYGSGDQVSLTLSNSGDDAPLGYYYPYTASAGTLSGSTLTMPDDDVTVSVGAIRSDGQSHSISYVDEKGDDATHDAIALDETMTTLSEGWYFVGKDINYTQTVYLDGDVNIILTDGKTMNVGTSESRISSGKGITGNTKSLTIYGQSDQSGTLNAYTSNTYNYAVYVKNYAQHGGIVTLDASNYNALDLNDGNLTLTRGTLNAKAGGTLNAIDLDEGCVIVTGGTLNADGRAAINGYIKSTVLNMTGGTVNATGEYGISGGVTMTGGNLTATGSSYGICGKVTMTGGNLTATSSEYGIGGEVTFSGGNLTADGTTAGISTSGTVSLSWTNPDDRIAISSFSSASAITPAGIIYGKVTIAEGKAFDNGSEVLTGTISSSSDFEAKLNGKTLRPFNGYYPPKNLTATDIAVTTATLTWEKGNDETQWQVKWSTDGGETWTSPVTVNSTQYEMTNLNPETTFQVQVLSVYGGGQYSYPKSITFTTHSASEAPIELTSNTTANTAVLSWKGFQDGYNMRYRQASVFPENFESYADDAAFNAVWTVIDLGGGENADELGWCSEGAITGKKGFRFSSYDKSSSYDQYLISPVLPKGETLTFGYQSSSGTKDKFRVGYSTTTNDLSAFEWGDEINSDSKWKTFVQEIPEGAKYFAINYTGQDEYRLYIDDITINGMQAADWENKTNVTSPQTITDLTPETKYEWQVQGIVDDKETEWSTVAYFTTNYKVSYIDENGEEQTTIAYSFNGNETMLAPGWYFVPNGVDLAYENALSCYKSDLNIILCDGAEMTVDVAKGKALFLSGNNRTLTIYGQSEGTGRLSVTGAVSEENQDGTIDVSNMIINGGIVSATSNEEYHAAIHGNVTLNRGQLTVNNDGSLASEGNLTVNGGQFRASSTVAGTIYFNGGTFSAAEVGDDCDIYLNWTSPSDRFYAGSIKSNDIFIADGKIFVDENGKLYQANEHGVIYDYPHGKTLRPFKTITLADNADNSSTISEWNGGVAEVTLSGRTLYKDGDWNTLVLPFDLAIKESALDDDNVKAMVLDGEKSELKGDELTLNFVDAPATIPAGTPFIIKWDKTDNLVNPVFSAVTIDDSNGDVTSKDGNVSFKGTYAPINWTVETPSILFVGEKNQLHWPLAGAHLNAFRAYFELADPNAKVREFNMTFGEETTSIDHSPLTIDHSADAWYTVNGVKLSGKPTKKGLYIHNGKKVVIK